MYNISLFVYEVLSMLNIYYKIDLIVKWNDMESLIFLDLLKCIKCRYWFKK